MPFKDPLVHKAYKAKWWREFRKANPDYHPTQMRNWRRTRNAVPPSRWRVKPVSFKSREEELEYLIAEQAKDDKKTQIKFNPGLHAREDEVYAGIA